MEGAIKGPFRLEHLLFWWQKCPTWPFSHHTSSFTASFSPMPYPLSAAAPLHFLEYEWYEVNVKYIMILCIKWSCLRRLFECITLWFRTAKLKYLQGCMKWVFQERPFLMENESIITHVLCHPFPVPHVFVFLFFLTTFLLLLGSSCSSSFLPLECVLFGDCFEPLYDQKHVECNTHWYRTVIS